MEMMDIRRMLLQRQKYTIGGLPVLVNNLKYGSSNGKYNVGNANNDWFVTGFFDSGTPDSKVYKIGNPHDTAGTFRLYNDKSASSYDWWGFSSGGRSLTSGGRYITFDAYKSLASRYYVYDATHGIYITKGKDILPGKTYGGLPVLVDNAYYINKNGRFNIAVTDPDYFIAGLFDTGTSDNKTYRWSFTRKPAAAWIHMHVFNDPFESSIDYWGSSTPEEYLPREGGETFPGRYIAFSIYKPIAADMYMYNETDGVYVFKGSNVH